MPYPSTIPYTEIHDFRFTRRIHVDSLTPTTIYSVDEYAVGTIAYICNLVLMAPAFLVRHASIASRLYNVLVELKRCPPTPDRQGRWHSHDASDYPRASAGSVKFEKTLYSYARYVIRTLVPGAKHSSNRTAPSPAEFIAEFATFIRQAKRREAYVWRRHSRSVSAAEECAQSNDLLVAANDAFIRVNTICRDPSAIDKVPGAVNAYVKFALLHNHILGAWSYEEQLTAMVDDYWALIEYMKEKKLPKNAIESLMTLVAAVQLSRNIVHESELTAIPPPPPEHPVLEHENATYDSDNAGLVW